MTIFSVSYLIRVAQGLITACPSRENKYALTLLFYLLENGERSCLAPQLQSQMTYSEQDRKRREAGVIYCFKMLSKEGKDLAKNKHRCQDTRRIRFKPGIFRIFSGSTVHHTSMYVRQDRKSAYRRANTTGDRAAKFCTVTSNTSGPQYGTCFVLPFWRREF